jgi:hypothetical protein
MVWFRSTAQLIGSYYVQDKYASQGIQRCLEDKWYWHSIHSCITLREHLIAVILVLYRVHVAQHSLPQLVEAALHFLVGLALELGCLSLCLASDLVGLALGLTGHLVRLALGLSGGARGGLLYGLSGFLCTDCQHAVQW